MQTESLLMSKNRVFCFITLRRFCKNHKPINPRDKEGFSYSILKERFGRSEAFIVLSERYEIESSRQKMVTASGDLYIFQWKDLDD